MSRSELVRLSGVSKQQLSRLEGGQIRMRLDHLKPFAKHLGFTPEQILLWGRYPGTMPDDHIESSDILGAHRERGENTFQHFLVSLIPAQKDTACDPLKQPPARFC